MPDRDSPASSTVGDTDGELACDPVLETDATYTRVGVLIVSEPELTGMGELVPTAVGDIGDCDGAVPVRKVSLCD